MNNELMDGFYCPITGELMNDPVIDREGNSYERSAIEDWIRINQTSPITRNPLYHEHLAPNRALKDAITDAINRGVTLPTKRSTAAAPTAGIEREHETGLPVQVQLKLYPTQEPSQDMYLHVSILATERKDRIPSDIVVVIDTSGSMVTTATAQGVENVNLTMLDIVKHAVKTIIHTLNANDRLAVVKFSTGAKVISPLMPMTDLNKRSLEQLLEPLQPDGGTNIWDGIKTALDLLKNDREAASMVSNSSILLLTDGEPTINPPRGNLPMLQRYGEQAGNKYPGIFSTFGFGYSLDSSLLAAMAEVGGGMYAFIPDSGFVGTAFVHALANTLVTTTDDAFLELEAVNGSRFAKDSKLNEDKHVHHGDRKVSIKIGSLQAGQAVDIVKRIHIDGDIGNGMEVVKGCVTYTSNNQAKAHAATTVNFGCNLRTDSSSTSTSDVNDFYPLAAQLFRLELVSVLKQVMAMFARNTPSTTNQLGNHALSEESIHRFLMEAGPLIVTLREKIDAWLASHPELSSTNDDSVARAAAAHSFIRDLQVDISGQVTEAMSRAAWFKRWGRHYLPSLCRAHELQQCNNFKDPGIQGYGGKVFSMVRDVADDCFGSLPPPTPTAPPAPTSYSYARRSALPPAPGAIQPSAMAAAAPVSMSMFNDRYGGCIHGKCKALLADGQSTREVELLKPGDQLYGNVVIECILRSAAGGGNNMQMNFIQLAEEGLIITPWHPVRVDGRWIFPKNLQSARMVSLSCDYVYSFLLRYASNSGNDDEDVVVRSKGRPASMVVNGIDCISLGHGIVDDPVASHDFFGSEKIIDNLRELEGWSSGIVTYAGEFRRDPSTGRVNGFLT
jgi:Mg-chelatase subunit ChlD